MVARAENGWSHGICSQEAKQDESTVPLPFSIRSVVLAFEAVLWPAGSVSQP